MEKCKVTKNELAYFNLLRDVYDNGEKRADRTGTGTTSLFGTMLELDLRESFPVLSLKKIHMKSSIGELIWMLSGATDINFLKENNIRIWDEWADKETNNVGKMYGYQWRKFGSGFDAAGDYHDGADQIKNVIDSIKKDPVGRRHIVTAWNPAELDQQVLPPCHILFQFYVRDGALLDCMVYQRSADMFLGVPFDITLYAMLTQLIAQRTKLCIGNLKFVFGDTHIYNNHHTQVKEYFKRMKHSFNEVDSTTKPGPYLITNPFTEIDKLTFADFDMVYYSPLSPIPAKVSV